MKTLILATAALVVALTVAQGIAQQDVKGVQQALSAAGHDPGPIDGVVGPQTTAALKAYQKQNGLSVTGRLDDATLAKLRPGGTTEPSPADPAQATKTGANAGEGSSYNRSNDKK